MLEGLERDIKAVRRAREALGDKAPVFGRGGGDRGDREGGRGGFSGRGGRGGGVLGKRRRDEDESDESDIPEDVKRIPMPKDTPPPVPKEVLDKWYQARRDRMAAERDGKGTNANSMPLGQNERRAGLAGDVPERVVEKVERPKVEAKVVYESKAVVRDLRKEAVAFVPAAVRVKMEKVKGVGGLVEPEEADKLEREGYMGTGSRKVELEEVEDEDG